MRATLLLFASVVIATGCDGILDINTHTLAEAGAHDAGEGTDGESGVTVNQGSDGGPRADARDASEQ
jgi:hypothetical protein